MSPAILLAVLLSLHPTFSLGETLIDPITILERQEDHLRRLEALIESLSKSVAVLESSLSSSSSSPPRFPDPSSPASPAGVVGSVVTKQKPGWSDRFQFLAAARLESAPVSASVLPYQDTDGLSKYFAVGDKSGRIFVFTSSGDVLFELPSHSDSPVTSMLSYLSFRRNESVLFTGHADGSISSYRFSETALNGDDWLTLTLSSSRPFALGSRDLDSPPVLAMELHQVGRIRYLLAADGGGRIRVFTENGTLYGTAIAASRPLAFMKQKLLFLTETGAGSLDLRSMAVKEIECPGLNGSLAKSYSFDGSERSKAYGFTAAGDLIHVVLLGDASNLKCRVRSIRKAEIQGPVSIQTIRGYLLAVDQEKVIAYNISSQFSGRVGSPRPLFVAYLHEIKSQFSNPDHGTLLDNPLIVTDRDKLVILGLQGGYVGIYRSNFPVFKLESNAVVWSAPVFLLILFLIVLWQFYVKKKDSLGWTGEEAFDNVSGAATGSILGPASGDRAFADGSSRGQDLRELRGSGLRGPTRRYVSPSSYNAAGSGVSFRSSSSSEPGFRNPADLKFMGKNAEVAGFPKRRDPLFQNTQAVDEHDN